MLKVNIKKTTCGFIEGRIEGYDIEIRDEKDRFVQGFFVTEININLK
jgi:uncharacterized membrane protein YqjE